MYDAKLFWNNVNAQIKAKNTTQEWLCKKCDLNLGTFKNRISAGRYPDALEAVLIASALGVTVEYLVTGQQPEQSDKLNDALQNMQNVIDQYKKQ
jgi:hypothetical protein